MITNIYNDAGNIKRAKVALRLRSAAGVLFRSLVPALSQEEFWLVEITEPLLEQGIDTTWRARTVVTRTSAGQRRSLGEDLDNAATRYKTRVDCISSPQSVFLSELREGARRAFDEEKEEAMRERNNNKFHFSSDSNAACRRRTVLEFFVIPDPSV
ncbi:hypothetical protein FPOAC1_001356 [Fusarium poae]|uniref:hypothetical protein n=1 Tax=Fusarium poae TaxID=36050 RepID=UPI001CE78485|nr:hypothetical protein FPOAC1_001356 [Fusarium poae]KAG8675378.1 hypothetical protein FPOAC1_001356 [Fusarium poae]